jgi:hypothetical protein
MSRIWAQHGFTENVRSWLTTFESLILGNLGQSRAVPGNWGADSGTRLGAGELARRRKNGNVHNENTQ